MISAHTLASVDQPSRSVPKNLLRPACRTRQFISPNFCSPFQPSFSCAKQHVGKLNSTARGPETGATGNLDPTAYILDAAFAHLAHHHPDCVTCTYASCDWKDRILKASADVSFLTSHSQLQIPKAQCSQIIIRSASSKETCHNPKNSC